MGTKSREAVHGKTRSRDARKKENSATRVSTLIRLRQRQTRRSPHGVGRNQQRRPTGPQFCSQPPYGPRCQPGPQPPAICVTWNGCGNGRGNAGTAPASKETNASINPAATAKNSRGWKNSLDLTATGATLVSPARQIKASNQTHKGPAAQSWTESLAFASSPPCGSATAVSALPPRLRLDR